MVRGVGLDTNYIPPTNHKMGKRKTIKIMYRKAAKSILPFGSDRAISDVVRKQKDGYVVNTPFGVDFISNNYVLKEIE